ncbi:hypothetical protein [Flavobacterium sp. LC2016-12]|uniref:TolB family protein n=1 Tax=Flavobacterium sp. LC2016-12 TaxID=2783794 RepID=UPI00188D5559|nr:hypothetical protein [Flavobacterium sp. LC2016-12]MBF4465427.1 hypothetical protein [Flavobacterium sp. LC2016-12]
MKYYTLIIITYVMTSCYDSKQEPKNNVYRPEFDISNDNKNIICSYYENNKGYIYKIDIINNQKRKISLESKYSLIKPIYSPNNKQIACLATTLTEEPKSKICLIDIESRKMVDLTNDSSLILEYVFSPSGKSIYFTVAGHFGNYSPIASKAPHGIDIYTIDISTKRIKKITDLNAYNLHGLSITNNNDSLLFHLTTVDNKSGLFEMDIKSKNLLKVNAVNDLRAKDNVSPYEYYGPVLSKDNSKIAFSEPYELYIMEKQTKISKLIFRREPNIVNVGDVKFFYSNNYLMISLPTDSKTSNSTGENFGFYTLNPETNVLKELNL